MPVVPSFNGDYVFGYAVVMVTSDGVRATQENHYFGISGSESLDGGLVGRMTAVTGFHAGTDLSGMVAAQELMRSYHDGFAYILLDTRGVTWVGVKLESFEPEPRYLIGSDGSHFQKYRARLRHLL